MRRIPASSSQHSNTAIPKSPADLALLQANSIKTMHPRPDPPPLSPAQNFKLYPCRLSICRLSVCPPVAWLPAACLPAFLPPIFLVPVFLQQNQRTLLGQKIAPIANDILLPVSLTPVSYRMSPCLHKDSQILILLSSRLSPAHLSPVYLSPVCLSACRTASPTCWPNPPASQILSKQCTHGLLPPPLAWTKLQNIHSSPVYLSPVCLSACRQRLRPAYPPSCRLSSWYLSSCLFFPRPAPPPPLACTKLQNIHLSPVYLSVLLSPDCLRPACPPSCRLSSWYLSSCLFFPQPICGGGGEDYHIWIKYIVYIISPSRPPPPAYISSSTRKSTILFSSSACPLADQAPVWVGGEGTLQTQMFYTP